MKVELTQEMHDAVARSEIGKWLSGLIAEKYAVNPEACRMPVQGGGNVIQQLWDAFQEGAAKE